jgi:hypothetical protein
MVDVFSGSRHESFPGEVISFDPEADVGLVRIAPEETLPALRVAPPSFAPKPGAPVTAVGCSLGAAPTAQQAKITAIDRYLGPPNIECSGLPVQGRSGGGLVTQEGYVIGVCSAADPSENRGLFAGLGAVQHELDRSGLAAVYQGESNVAVAQADAPRKPKRAKTQDGGVEATPVSVVTNGPESMSTSELADLLEEVGEAEVVCVIRPLSEARAKSRVVVLDRASQQFLAQLALEQRTQDAREVTSLVVPERPAARPLLRVPDPNAPAAGEPTRDETVDPFATSQAATSTPSRARASAMGAQSLVKESRPIGPVGQTTVRKPLVALTGVDAAVRKHAVSIP